MITATALGLGIGWVLPAQQASGPNWKDRAEYDTAQEYDKAKDAKGKLAALDKWTQGYPDSELWETRDNLYLAVYGESKDCRKSTDKAKAIRAKKPEHYFSLTTVLNCIAQLQGRTDADLTYAMETADFILDNEAKVFAATNKPASYQDPQWTSEKPLVIKSAQQTKVYVLQQLKKWADLEMLLTKYITADPTQAAYSLSLATAQYNQRQQNAEKVPLAIYNFARAGSYTGQNALPAANQKQALTTAETAFKAWHGDDKAEWEKVIAAVKTGALPPAGFTIVNKNVLAQNKFEQQQEWDKAHPELVFWRDSVQIPLSTPNAASVFEMNYKDAGLPPAGLPFTMFTAKIVSLSPETNPKEIVVEQSDPLDPNETAAKLNAKLVLDPPPPGTMAVGSEIKFKGKVASFQPDPLQLTFDVDTEMKDLEGWTGTGPANAKSGKAKAAPKGGAAKGKGKGKGK